MRLLTIQQAAELLQMTESAVRYRIYENVDEFADRCVVRLGRAVRIREDRLLEAIDEQTGAKPFKFSEAWHEKNRAALKAARKRQREARKAVGASA